MKLFQDLLPAFWGNDCQPLAGGSISIFKDRSSESDANLLRLFSKPGGGAAELANPLRLNSAGRADAPAYIDGDGAYAVVRDRNGVKVKDFDIEAENSIDSGEAIMAKSADELSKAVNPASGQYAVVREPAPDRLYKWVADSTASADGVFCIAGSGGRWHLIPQSNWVYSSWWGAECGFSLFMAAANRNGYDIAVNSKLINANGSLGIGGRLKLMAAAEISASAPTNIYCAGGFEAARLAAVHASVAFELLGGSYDAWNLQGKRIAGRADALHVNENYSILPDDTLSVGMLTGSEGCELKVYGALEIAETPWNPAFSVETIGGGQAWIKGRKVAAKIFKGMEDWSRIYFYAGSGLEFYEEHGEYAWLKAPGSACPFIGGAKLLIGSGSEALPFFSEGFQELAIENDSGLYLRAPNGVRLDFLHGKFRFSGSEHSGGTFRGTMDPASMRAAFTDCHFTERIEIQPSVYSSGVPQNGRELNFHYCAFDEDIALGGGSHHRLFITDCIFNGDAKIDVDGPLLEGRLDLCDFIRNWSSGAAFKPINWAVEGAHFSLARNGAGFDLHTNLLYGAHAPEEIKGMLLAETAYRFGAETTIGFDPQFYEVNSIQGPGGSASFEIKPVQGGSYSVAINFVKFIPGAAWAP